MSTTAERTPNAVDQHGWSIEHLEGGGVWLTHPDGTRFGNPYDPIVPPAVRLLACRDGAGAAGTTNHPAVEDADSSTGAFSIAARRLADDIANETALAASHHDTVGLREIVRAASDALTVIAGARLAAENTLFTERDAARS